MTLHRLGLLDQARADYEGLLAPAPDDANLLGLLGVVAIRQKQSSETVALLRRALAAPEPNPKIHLRNVNNLFALLTAERRWEDAPELAGMELPDWPGDAPPNASERATVLSLAEALSVYGNPERALTLLESVMPYLVEDSEALILTGRLRVQCGDAQRALLDLERASLLDPENWQIMAATSVARDRLGDGAGAREATALCVRAAPLYIALRHEAQEGTILALNPSPSTIRTTDHSLYALHFARNYISQASALMPETFRFASVFADMPGPPPRIPAADVVFNNLASGEQMNIPGQLDRAVALVERIGLAVINHRSGIFRMRAGRPPPCCGASQVCGRHVSSVSSTIWPDFLSSSTKCNTPCSV